ncbi:unnamed protein product, partial [Staurois parvus]
MLNLQNESVCGKCLFLKFIFPEVYLLVEEQFAVDPLYTHHVVGRGGLTIWKLGHCPRARGQ